MKLKDNLDARKVLDRCYEKGVLFMPGDIFYKGKEGRDTLRIGFGRVSDSDIEQGIKIIGETVKELSSRKWGM